MYVIPQPHDPTSPSTAAETESNSALRRQVTAVQFQQYQLACVVSITAPPLTRFGANYT